MKVRYNGPYDAIVLDVPGLPNEVTVGQELDVDEEVGAGLIAGSFELAPGASPPPPPADDPNPLD